MKHAIDKARSCAGRHKRRLVLVGVLVVGLVLLAHPAAEASDVFQNIGPAPQLPPGGWVDRFPVERYSLDQYFPAISVGFTSGVDASGVAPMIAYFGAQIIWLITCFLANGVILLFTLAFNLNLLTGDGTPGSGALTPVGQAIHRLYTSTFGTPWLIVVIILVGCWAMWKALVQRRYTETASSLAVSLVFFLAAVAIVTQPQRTIAPASKLSNELSTALLSLTNEGSINSEAQTKRTASNDLFELLVLNPWTVLEFGGLEQCAKTAGGKTRSVAVRPLSSDPTTDTQLAAQLEDTSEVQAQGKTCVNDRNKYAAHFLAYPFQSHDRNAEHEALENGDSEDLPDSDPAKNTATYKLSPTDEPAAEAMGKGGQYERLLLALVILIGETGAFLLLGALAVGVILAQILLLALLAFAPVALLVGIFPGRGHDFFRSWVGKLAGYLARKVIYSLILAVVLVVCQALDEATSNLGWLLAFALQAAFLWTIFIQRNRLTNDLLKATVGEHATNDGTSRLANLYYATRLARLTPLPHLPKRRDPEPPPPGAPNPAGPPEQDSETPPSGDTNDGTPPPAPGGGSPDGGRPGPHETPTHGAGSPNTPPTDTSHEPPTVTHPPAIPTGTGTPHTTPATPSASTRNVASTSEPAAHTSPPSASASKGTAGAGSPGRSGSTATTPTRVSLTPAPVPAHANARPPSAPALAQPDGAVVLGAVPGAGSTTATHPGEGVHPAGATPLADRDTTSPTPTSKESENA